eukprot:scaffold207_cov409-Prasinococcus_capsulatus_cf.AAC.33
MRKLLLELEPYREAYARQQITLAFSLYDLPWLTASNVSVIDPRGRVSLLSFDLPAQCACAKQLVWKDFLRGQAGPPARFVSLGPAGRPRAQRACAVARRLCALAVSL